MERPAKDVYYLNIAYNISLRGTCLKSNFGAIIVKNDEIIATGYTGAPRGTPNCCDIGTCLRKELGIPRGERYELCRSVHAEQNAIISSSRNLMIGATMYLSGHKQGKELDVVDTCLLCRKLIVNSGITTVVYKNVNLGKEENNYIVRINVEDWVNDPKAFAIDLNR